MMTSENSIIKLQDVHRFSATLTTPPLSAKVVLKTVNLAHRQPPASNAIQSVISVKVLAICVLKTVLPA